MSAGGCLPPGGGVCLEGCLPGEVSAWRGGGGCVCLSPVMHAGKPTPSLNRMTHRCKILPCPKLRLRAVNMFLSNLNDLQM